MALTVTAGSATADSYASLADLYAHAEGYGLTLTGTDAEKEAALRRAAIYMDNAYVWRGIRAAQAQARAWPRADAGYDSDGYSIDGTTIPPRIIEAQCEIALALLAGTDPWAAQTTGAVARKRVKAGPVETETEYLGSRVVAALPAVTALLRDYATGSPAGVRMVRG